MKKTSLLIAAASFLVAASSLNAASGIFGTGVTITNKGTVTLYESTLLGDSRHAPFGSSPALNTTGFDSVDLGIFDTTTSDSLVLNGGGILTFKNGTDDVTGASIFYSIDGGSFSSIALSFNEDNVSGSGGDQRWYIQDSSIDLLSGLSSGAHTISVYFEAPFTFDFGSGTHSENNGGSNFTADFTVVPEPSAYALLAGILGLAYVAARRRK